MQDCPDYKVHSLALFGARRSPSHSQSTCTSGRARVHTCARTYKQVNIAPFVRRLGHMYVTDRKSPIKPLLSRTHRIMTVNVLHVISLDGQSSVRFVFEYTCIYTGGRARTHVHTHRLYGLVMHCHFDIMATPYR